MTDDRERRTGTDRVLSMEQTMQLKELQDLAADFVTLCQKMGSSRDLSLAVTNMQQAEFWACRHVTGLKP